MASRHRGPLRAFRIADIRHPILDGTGAMLHGARWNSPGRRVIYAAETYAGALLEVLAHTAGRVPRRQVAIEIQIPPEIAVEEVAAAEIPGWDDEGLEVSRAFGDQWYDSRRSAVLLVPSLVTRIERNVLIHQEHPDFARIRAGVTQP